MMFQKFQMYCISTNVAKWGPNFVIFSWWKGLMVSMGAFVTMLWQESVGALFRTLDEKEFDGQKWLEMSFVYGWDQQSSCRIMMHLHSIY